MNTDISDKKQEREIWSESIREEIISALWLIAALLAWQNDIKWLAWFLFVKAAIDELMAIKYAWREKPFLF